MAIQKLNIQFEDDGSVVLGKQNLQPIVNKINEIIDAGVQPATTKILVAGESNNLAYGYCAVHGLKAEDVKASAYLAEVGEYVVLHAISNDGYSFVSWSDGSTLKDRTILIDSSMQSGKTLTATFAGSTVSILASSNISGVGSVTGAGQKEINSQVTLTATVINNLYHFVKWQKKNSSGVYVDIVGATDATYTFTASVNEEYKAVFAANDIGDIKVTSNYDSTTNKLKITNIEADNAAKYYVINGSADPELFDSTSGYEVSAAATLVVKATSDINGVADRSTEIVSVIVNADDGTIKLKSTHKMYIAQNRDASETEYDSVVEANTESSALTPDEDYGIYSNGKHFHIEIEQ